MKKRNRFRLIIVYPIILFHAQSTFGQTLSCQTNCPKAGEVFSARTSSPVINSPGANQVWNFSSIDAISPGSHLISYHLASSVPSSSMYPQANLIRTGFGATAFLSAGNGGVRRANPSTSNVNMDPMELPLPFAYGDTYSEIVISTAVSGTDTIVTRWQNYFVAQGSGTLILPSGIFPDVLAIKFMSTQTATKNSSSYGYVYYTTSYYYYSVHISHPLLYTSLIYETGPVDHAPYTEFIDQIILSVEEAANDEGGKLIVSPNPANEMVNINFTGNTKGTVLLRNSLGRELIEQKFEEGNCSLSVSALPEGIYVLSFVSATYTINKKLIISK